MTEEPTPETNTSDSEIRTPAEFAELYHFHVNTVYEMLASDEIPGAIRMGRSWRIDMRIFRERTHGVAK